MTPLLPLINAAFHGGNDAQLIEPGRAQPADHVVHDTMDVVDGGEHALRSSSTRSATASSLMTFRYSPQLVMQLAREMFALRFEGAEVLTSELTVLGKGFGKSSFRNLPGLQFREGEPVALPDHPHQAQCEH